MTGDECKCPKCQAGPAPSDDEDFGTADDRRNRPERYLDTESQAIQAERDKPLGYAPPDIPEPSDRGTQAMRKQYRVGYEAGYEAGYNAARQDAMKVLWASENATSPVTGKSKRQA